MHRPSNGTTPTNATADAAAGAEESSTTDDDEPSTGATNGTAGTTPKVRGQQSQRALGERRGAATVLSLDQGMMDVTHTLHGRCVIYSLMPLSLSLPSLSFRTGKGEAHLRAHARVRGAGGGGRGGER